MPPSTYRAPPPVRVRAMSADASGLMALASTTIPRKPANCRATSSAPCGGQIENTTSVLACSSARSSNGVNPDCSARRNVASLRPVRNQPTSWPRPTRQAATAAPMAPGCRTANRLRGISSLLSFRGPRDERCEPLGRTDRGSRCRPYRQGGNCEPQQCTHQPQRSGVRGVPGSACGQGRPGERTAKRHTDTHAYLTAGRRHR